MKIEIDRDKLDTATRESFEFLVKLFLFLLIGGLMVLGVVCGIIMTIITCPWMLIVVGCVLTVFGILVFVNYNYELTWIKGIMNKWFDIIDG